MKFDIEGLAVYFPFKHIYPEQLQYMLSLKKVFDSLNHNSIIQVPPAISKATCLFSLYFSYFLKFPEKLPKLFFSVKGTFEINHTAAIAKHVFDNLEKETGSTLDLLVLSAAEKKNLCIHEFASKKGSREGVENECIKRIAPWVRGTKKKESVLIINGTHKSDNEINSCMFYENYIKQDKIPLRGCYSLDELKNFGQNNVLCPYYVADDVFQSAKVIICNYFFLYSLKRMSFLDKNELEGAILFIDECCGLDEDISELFTERISRISLDYSIKCIEDLNQKLKTIQESELKRYDEEYQKLVKGLSKEDLDLNKINKNLHNPVEQQPQQLVKFPGYIRKPEHFITHIKKFILFLKKTKFGKKTISYADFLDKFVKETLVDPNMVPLSHFRLRLSRLLYFLHLPDNEVFLPLYSLVQFASLCGTYPEGFEVIFDSIQDTVSEISESSKEIVSLVCLDPKIPFLDLTDKFSSVILNTECLKDVELFANIIGLTAERLDRDPLTFATIAAADKLHVLPVIISKGADQIELSTEFSKKHDAGVMRNYSNMIVELCDAVPDGILCMFPNFKYLKDIGLDFYDEILAKKLIFAETIDLNDSIKSVVGYKKACESGRGGVFLGLLRGNVVGKVNFDISQAKCIIIFGIPLEYARPREFLAKVKYFKQNKNIPENEYIIYSAMKEVNKTLGNVITKKEDSFAVIFADRRFIQQDKISRMPDWLLRNLDDASKGIPSDQVFARVTRFMKASEIEKDWTKYAEDNLKKLFDELKIYS